MPSTDTREPQDNPMEIARRWPADSPLHSVEDDVAGLLEYACRENDRGMSGEANFFWRCASRIAHARLRSPVERGEGANHLDREEWASVDVGALPPPLSDADRAAILASPPAPVERCGAVTTFGGAFPPMACTLPIGHTGQHDADSAAPARAEGVRERVAAEVWIGGAYPDERDHPQTRRVWREMPRTDVTVRRAYETADRILAALPVQGEER